MVVVEERHELPELQDWMCKGLNEKAELLDRGEQTAENRASLFGSCGDGPGGWEVAATKVVEGEGLS
ncbi:hypothetical protein NL676_014923 [Syzygium grande]|nr:hypothetical protein NL676_014923 [Syzygium grande]